MIWTDDTPIRVLAPGRGKTREARFWVYAHNPRPWGGTGPPVALATAVQRRRPPRRVILGATAGLLALVAGWRVFS